jgi:hypothetical protein
MKKGGLSGPLHASTISRRRNQVDLSALAFAVHEVHLRLAVL